MDRTAPSGKVLVIEFRFICKVFGAKRKGESFFFWGGGGMSFRLTRKRKNCVLLGNFGLLQTKRMASCVNGLRGPTCERPTSIQCMLGKFAGIGQLRSQEKSFCLLRQNQLLLQGNFLAGVYSVTQYM